MYVLTTINSNNSIIINSNSNFDIEWDELV
jgi:hypothetical protein